jgi:glycosyltransferase involved in cell wall biosynthesis
MEQNGSPQRALAIDRAQHLVSRPVICILALSRISDDPRVRRQGDAFSDAGWQVVGVGLPGGVCPGPAWVMGQQRDDGAETADYQCNARCSRKSDLFGFWAARIRDGGDLLAARLGGSVACRSYWRLSGDARNIYDRASRIEADVWLANDWAMLPVASRLAKEKGGFYGYDTHELATDEFADRLRWRFWKRPLTGAIERRSIGGAAVVSAVSEGIAERLQDLYSLPRLPAVIRNTPIFESTPFRPTTSPIRVIYQGIIVPGRGLEAVIDSVCAWRPEFDLTIRGPGDASFLHALQRRIYGRGLGTRVRLAPPVPMTSLVQEAAGFDIGLFALPRSSRHNELALPNKLFEYIMAGLAICVTELPEMARLLRQYHLGMTFPQLDPGAIAETINRLDPQTIDRYKRNALIAAQHLCWERERELLLAAYAHCLARPGNSARQAL